MSTVVPSSTPYEIRNVFREICAVFQVKYAENQAFFEKSDFQDFEIFTKNMKSFVVFQQIQNFIFFQRFPDKIEIK